MTITYVIRDIENGAEIRKTTDKFTAEMYCKDWGVGVPSSRYVLEKTMDAKSLRMSLRAKAAWQLVARHREEYAEILTALTQERT